MTDQIVLFRDAKYIKPVSGGKPKTENEVQHITTENDLQGKFTLIATVIRETKEQDEKCSNRPDTVANMLL